MIEIREAKSKQLPGETSLFVSFDYNPTIINLIKSCEEGYFWHKKTKNWEIPCISLSFILDNLCYYDNITLYLLCDNPLQEESLQLSLTYKTKPFNYQLEGIKYGLSGIKNWLLLDACGLGKSLQLIYLAEELKAQKNIKHCLVICGVNTLKTNWKREIERHSNLDAIILGEKINSKNTVTYSSITDRAKQLEDTINEFFVITNIESFRNDKIIEAFKNSKNKFDMIILDEAHRCKSPTSIQGHNLLKLDAEYKIAATGTLLLNNPLDAYIPLKWIGRNNCNYSAFKNFYCKYGGMLGREIVAFKNLDMLKEQISSCSLRRTKELLDLPPKTIINELIEMNDAHRKFYNDIKAGVKEEADRIQLNTSSLLGMVTRLRQATSCPSVLTSSEILSSKLERAEDLVEQITSQGDKVVIFSTFKEPVYILQEKLKSYSPLIVTGDIREADISEKINQFQIDNKYKVMICTIAKMGTGVTLTAANYAIFIDQPWTYGLYEQAMDRIYRIGSDKPVFIYNFICKDTIDEHVSQIIDRKEAIGDYIVDDITSERVMNNLRKYIKEL